RIMREGTHQFLQMRESEAAGEYEYDIAICWRDIDNTFRISKRIAKKTIFWPHDILYRESPLLAQVDAIFWLSDYQRLQYTSIQPSLASVPSFKIGNGIKANAECNEKRDPFRCIYASNYSRGLETLLDIWPSILTVYPSCSLHIFYGWET